MASSISERALELFEQVLQIEAADRSTFLDETCADNSHLRREVESLLEHEQRLPQDFMSVRESGVGVSSLVLDGNKCDTSPAADSMIGQTVGRFRITELIATGGAGVVYLAEQEQPKRLVALKLLKHGWVSESALRRFHLESELLAYLRNPNIAQVYDAGIYAAPPSSQSVPYFAMEYVQHAKKITEYAETQRLDLRERLGLFLQVCDAVQHGHQKGVIHRDLKPGNILVDDEGQVKVIDFGVARVTDTDITLTTMHTDTCQIVGTLQYMSPEQCAADRMEIDTRCDVYALGVVFYLLVSGHVPYDISNTTLQTAMRIICEHEPFPPSRFDRSLRGDIDAIVAKALTKERSQRYGTVAELAGDIQRHLHGDAIEARQPTPWVRAVRWIARHPTASTTIFSTAIAMIIVGSVFLGVSLAKRQPDHVIWIDNTGEARLMPVAGEALRVWRTANVGKAPSRVSALEPSPIDSSSRLFAIGFHYLAPDTENAGDICVYNIDRDYENHLWCDRMTSNGVPTEAEEVFQTPSVVSWGFLDIFAESPGREVVAIHVIGDYSPRCLRVYEPLTGEVLFEFWHDGTIGDLYYMADEGLLICMGGDSRRESKHLYKGGLTTGSSPMVLFAVRPQLRVRSRHFVTEPQSSTPALLEWYKYLLFPEPGNYLIRWGQLRHPAKIKLAGRLVDVAVRIIDPSMHAGGLMFEVDGNGFQVGVNRTDEEYYELAARPDFTLFTLDSLSGIANRPLIAGDRE